MPKLPLLPRLPKLSAKNKSLVLGQSELWTTRLSSFECERKNLPYELFACFVHGRLRLKRKLSGSSYCVPALLSERIIELLAMRVRELNLSRRLVVSEEADETVFWIELLADLRVIKKERLDPLLIEARELTAIFRASRQTTKRR